MHKTILTFITLVTVFMATAQHKGFQPVVDMNGFRTAFSNASSAIHSITSNFTQEKNLSLLSEKITSKGKFWFKKENLVRMEYQQPFKYLMIINGNNVYIKDGQQENRISVKSNKLFQKINKITIDCVKGTVLSNTDFKTKAFENSQYYLIEMVPVAKDLKDFFSMILVTVDRKDYSVSKINMIEQGGDNTLISFQQKEINTTIADAVFADK